MPRHQILLKIHGFTLSEKLINRAINGQLKRRHASPKVVGVEVVGINRMKTLNRRFLGKNAATDVLSFPLDKIPGEKVANIGTIVICNDIIKLQAKDHRTSFKGEFLKMLRHGVDHLLGVHHK